MKFKNTLVIIAMTMPLGFLLSGCPTFATAIPSLIPSLIPSVNYNSIDMNTNQISCYKGGTFSSDYCSIPISRFVSITSGYADPYNVNLLLDYDLNNQHHFFFDDINHASTIDKLNKQFLNTYPAPDKFAQLPTALQNLYIRMREKYIPNHDYKNLYSSYIYLYTINALHFATNPCSQEDQLQTNQATAHIIYQRDMLYKAFAIRYSNEVLHHVAGDLSSKYDSENDLYNAVYKYILAIDYNKLQNMAQDLFATINNKLPPFESSFFSETGVSFGNIGTFGCADKGGFWMRYDYEYFGNNVSGINLRVQFIQHDTLSQIDSSKTALIMDNQESAASK